MVRGDLFFETKKLCAIPMHEAGRGGQRSTSVIQQSIVQLIAGGAFCPPGGYRTTNIQLLTFSSLKRDPNGQFADRHAYCKIKTGHYWVILKVTKFVTFLIF